MQRTHAQLVSAYRRRPRLAADAATRHEQMARAAHDAGEHDQAVHHWDRADAFHAVLDELVRCRRCGRQLTDPTSIERRAGRECWTKHLDDTAPIPIGDALRPVIDELERRRS